MNSSDPNHQEIIIIKRSSGEEDGHHGGAWKIAFADFMTAMMALFLVLWLINAANEETKRSVASYFNPVKLVDRNRSTKGVNDQRGGPTSDPSESGAEIPKDQHDTSDLKSQEIDPGKQSAVERDSIFFASPLEQMNEIVATAQEAHMLLGSAPKPQPDAMIENFADPFGPNFWNKTKGGEDNTAPREKESKELLQSEIKANANSKANDSSKLDGKVEKQKPSPITADIDEQQVAALDSQSTAQTTAQDRDKIDQDKKNAELAEQLKKSVQDLLSKEGVGAEKLAQIIEVKGVEEGVLFSVTDELDVPIFKVGSAVPEASLILAVDAIAKSLKEKQGSIHIHGHTDGREYKSIVDGNWRLSTDRAKATYFMLLRGGLVDQRIVEIAGFADRKLRKPEDPLADENRRIEILLETK